VKHVRGEAGKLGFVELREMIQKLQKQLLDKNVDGVQIQQYETQLQEANSQTESVQKELESARQLLRDKEATRAALAHKLDETTRTHATQVCELQMQLKLSASELQAQQASVSELLGSRKHNHDTNQIPDSIHLNQPGSGFEDQIVTLKAEQRVLEHKCCVLQEALAHERDVVEETRSAFDVATERCAELEAELMEAEAEHRQRIRDLEVDNAGKKKSLKSLTAICELRRGELEQVLDECDILRKENIQLRKEQAAAMLDAERAEQHERETLQLATKHSVAVRDVQHLVDTNKRSTILHNGSRQRPVVL